jgi:hypothetical protein
MNTATPRSVSVTLAQVDGPQADRRLQLQQPPRRVVGWRDLPLEFEAQQLLVEAPRPVDVVRAQPDVVHDAGSHGPVTFTAPNLQQKHDMSVRIGAAYGVR